MKTTFKILIAIFGLVNSVGAQQWNGSSNANGNLYRNGNVGIGTVSPNAKLHINNGDHSYGAILANASESNFSLYVKTLTTQPVYIESFRLGLKHGVNENNGFISFYRGGSSDGGYLGFSTNGLERMRISRNGNIGLGTASPNAKLHINNGDHSYGAILANASESNFSLYVKTLTTQPAYVESFRLGLKHGVNENNGFISFYRGGSSDGGYLGFSTNGLERMRISRNGNIGMGTTTQGAYKLAVNGKIRAKEIVVETGWSDFVFEEDYDLPTLKEVESHIKEKGHLKDIPSAKEVEENGIGLGEMDSKLLQKIEELTLYILQQQKEVETQNQKIKKQEIEIKKLTHLIRELFDFQEHLEKLKAN